MKSSSSTSTLLLIYLSFLIFFTLLPSLSLSRIAGEDRTAEINATESVDGSKDDSFADMIDRALEKEFTENEQTGETDVGGFNNSVAEQQAVLETVARVKPKKNDTKEEKSFQLHDVFNLDNENQAEDTPTLIDRKDNVFIISKPKSKYPVLQLDLRLISDLVVVIVSATGGGIAFSCYHRISASRICYWAWGFELCQRTGAGRDCCAVWRDFPSVCIRAGVLHDKATSCSSSCCSRRPTTDFSIYVLVWHNSLVLIYTPMHDSAVMWWKAFRGRIRWSILVNVFNCCGSNLIFVLNIHPYVLCRFDRLLKMAIKKKKERIETKRLLKMQFYMPIGYKNYYIDIL